MSTLLRLAAALLAIIVLADQSANALDADDAASRMKKQASASASKKRATDSDKLFVQSRKHSKSIFPPKRFESSRARSHEKANTYESDLLLVKELIDSSKYEQLRLPIDKLVSSFNGMVGLQRLDNSLKLLRFAEILVKVRRVDEARQLYSAVFCTIAGAPSVTSELETEVVAVGKFLLQVDEPEKALEVLNFASSFFEKTDKKPGAGEFRRLVVLAERQQQAPRPHRQSRQTSASGSENQPFRSEFVALGSKSVSLEGNTRLGSVSSSAERVSRIGDPDGGLAGSFGSLYCRGFVSGNSDFSISGTRPWGLDVPVRSQLSNRPPVSDTPETPPYPLPNALSAPPDAKDIRNDNESSLVTGDYIVSNIQLRDVRKRGTGVLRLFIEDAKKTEGPAFWAVNNSSINSYRFDSRSVPGEFQIWYQGDGDIKLDHNCEFCGIIYAPNARVELGPNNVHFYGAIVARDIYADGNVSLLFDRDLLKIRNWKDKSAFESTTNSIVSSSSASSSRTGMIGSPPPTTAEDRIKAIRQQMGLGAGRHSGRMDQGSRLKYQDSFEERTKARFEVMKSAYEQAKAKDPHGDVTIKTLSRLAKYHLSHKDYQEAKKAYLELSKLLFTESGAATSREKIQCLLDLARVYIETGSKNQARDEISKARELDSDLRTEQPSYSRLHKYIVLEIESGQKNEAAKHLDLADQAVMSEMQKEPNKRYQTHLLKNLARHWRDLGRGDKADALESKIAELEKQK